jgi:hypothetical protein
MYVFLITWRCMYACIFTWIICIYIYIITYVCVYLHYEEKSFQQGIQCTICLQFGHSNVDCTQWCALCQAQTHTRKHHANTISCNGRTHQPSEQLNRFSSRLHSGKIIGSIVVWEGGSIVVSTELRTTTDQISFRMKRPYNRRSLGQLGITMADDGDGIIAGKENISNALDAINRDISQYIAHIHLRDSRRTKAMHRRVPTCR